MTGKFITFEGIDGAGKSSHIDWVAEWLRQQGKAVVTTREPGGTALGEKLRHLLLSEPMDLQTEALLMFAARQEHLEQVIKPALAKGRWVVCDRFTDATFAYQSGGRGLDKHKLAVLENWTHPDLQPDLTFLFDLPCEIARERIALSQRNLDRFEQERAQFHERVRLAYLERAYANPHRIRTIEASEPLEKIKKKLEEILLTIC